MPAKTSTNGVDLEPVGQFIEAVKSDRKAAHITFKASSSWLGGTKAAVSITDFLSNGAPASPAGRKFRLVVDEPQVLGGAVPPPIRWNILRQDYAAA